MHKQILLVNKNREKRETTEENAAACIHVHESRKKALKLISLPGACNHHEPECIICMPAEQKSIVGIRDNRSSLCELSRERKKETKKNCVIVAAGRWLQLVLGRTIQREAAKRAPAVTQPKSEEKFPSSEQKKEAKKP